MTAAGEVVGAARFLVVFVCGSLFHLSGSHPPGQDATGKAGVSPRPMHMCVQAVC